MSRNSNFWFDKKTSTGLPKECDIVIIGGGIIGICTLINILGLNPSTSVVLLEESSVGFRASGRASGQLMLRGTKPFYELIDSIGEKDTAEYISFMDKNIRAIPFFAKALRINADFNNHGGIRLASTPEEAKLLKVESRLINKHSTVSSQWLNKNDIKSLFSHNMFFGGLYIPTESTFNPYKYVMELVNVIGFNGKRIISGCSVEEVDNGKITVKNRGVINAKHVIYCTNAYSANLLPEFSNFITPFRGQMISTNPLSEDQLNTIPDYSMTTNGCMDYFRKAGNVLLCGGKRYVDRKMERGVMHDGEVNPDIRRSLHDLVKKVFPSISYRGSNSWSGIMCKTDDCLPLVGKRPGYENEWVCIGFNGIGLSHSYLVSQMVPECIIRGNDIDSIFNSERIPR